MLKLYWIMTERRRGNLEREYKRRETTRNLLIEKLRIVIKDRELSEFQRSRRWLRNKQWLLLEDHKWHSGVRYVRLKNLLQDQLLEDICHQYILTKVKLTSISSKDLKSVPLRELYFKEQRKNSKENLVKMYLLIEALLGQLLRDIEESKLWSHRRVTNDYNILININLTTQILTY